MSLRKQQQNGSSLIEIMVTVLVFSIGMLGMAALQLTALRSTSDSSQRSQAIWLVQDIAERMRANPSGSIADYTGNASAPDCTALPVNQCADRYNPTSSAVVSATTCSPAKWLLLIAGKPHAAMPASTRTVPTMAEPPAVTL